MQQVETILSTDAETCYDHAFGPPILDAMDVKFKSFQRPDSGSSHDVRSNPTRGARQLETVKKSKFMYGLNGGIGPRTYHAGSEAP
ncbi:hypothetical protein P8C59_007514 [Phyllachora maydis]|uniref:Uncharacterized protein n=1 Tax=Phyllachora maydis TaxID=1825666 RepID=A0AAD9I8K9_9PEZI|nr:hypothetical protein P8C59_007514 [Phyllachora maydis]